MAAGGGPKSQATVTPAKSKNKKKSQKARQVLSNPLMGANITVVEKQSEELKKLLQEKLTNLYPKTNVPTGVVLSELLEEDKKKLFALPKKERVEKIKSLKSKRRAEIKSTGDFLPQVYQSGIIFGIKKTLKALEKDQIKAIVYDSNANFEALKVLFDRGQIPMVPLPDLSPVVRDIVEFPALCISFPKGNLEEEVTKHFEVSKGPSINDVDNFSEFLTPPPISAVFWYYLSAILTIFIIYYKQPTLPRKKLLCPINLGAEVSMEISSNE